MSYYEKLVPPTEVEQVPGYLDDEMEKISDAINNPSRYTQAQLLSVDSVINRRLKAEGVQVWDTTNKRPLWAAGNAPADDWLDAQGTIVFSPV